MAAGPAAALESEEASLTGAYLSGRMTIPVPGDAQIVVGIDKCRAYYPSYATVQIVIVGTVIDGDSDVQVVNGKHRQRWVASDFEALFVFVDSFLGPQFLVGLEAPVCRQLG